MDRPRVIRRGLAGLVALAFGLASGAAASGPGLTGTGQARKIPTVDGIPPLFWSGMAWLPSSGCNVNHACFRQTPDTLFVDTSGRLHLRIINANGQWWSSELSSVEQDFGYGTYTWVVDTPIGGLDPASVIGMFTYNDQQDVTAPKGDPHVGHLEADFEVTRWRRPNNKYNVQDTIQPFWNPANVRELHAPTTQAPLTFQITWAPNGTMFVVRRGTGAAGAVVNRWWTSSPIGAPRIGTKAVVDFWTWGPPVTWLPQEVVIDSFSYVPSGPLPVGVLNR